MNKIILDACCGGKMFWYDKENPHVLFMDKRSRPKGFMRVRPAFNVSPDIVADFTNMPFEDGSFKMVVFDPPHTIRPHEDESKEGVIAARYGRFAKDTWEEDLRKGFSECWRVLEDNGTLIFKWAECDKKINDIKHLFPSDPLFGSRPGSRKGSAIWLCFMKFPNI